MDTRHGPPGHGDVGISQTSLRALVNHIPVLGMAAGIADRKVPWHGAAEGLVHCGFLVAGRYLLASAVPTWSPKRALGKRSP